MQSRKHAENNSEVTRRRRIFPLDEGQRCHADGVAEGEAAEGSGGPEGGLVRLHCLLGPPSSFSGRATGPEGV